MPMRTETDIRIPEEHVAGETASLAALDVRVQAELFDPGAQLSAFAAGRQMDGAVASFTGLVRKVEQDADSTLELLHYPGFTEKQILLMAETCRTQFEISDVLIIHRHGKMAVSEPIVFVAVSAAHRRAAFAACEWLMDHLKTDAPFWKRETTASGANWIEPTGFDQRRTRKT